MATPQWTAFAGAALLVTAGLLVLSRASSRAVFGTDSDTDADSGEHGPNESGEGADRSHRPPTGPALLLNLAFTHALLGLVVLAAAWYASIPPEAFGVGPVSARTVSTSLALGLGVYLASEATTAVAGRLGAPADERLRALLAPSTPTEWGLLLLVVLPAVAAAEELLFRGVLIGAMAAGFGLPEPALVVASSALFGLGHGAQGRLGVIVTAGLGLVFGAAFVLTESLAVVVVAHYTVDVLEFVVHEWALDGGLGSPRGRG